ncbi:procollagen-proline 4-dioxygenase [Theileria orientalis]|uniref:Procollagen-proline 4-dioxygenase n=1 Tax=Theileria orientalis TaxID=68886 RepID=A0A976MBK7_THEOR|nr:procollagen-proline 4-dioxygenase [Theileria orientalis]
MSDEIKDQLDSSTEYKETKLVECDCTFESFGNVDRVVTESEDGYDIKCVKKSCLIIESKNSERRMEKFYISIDPNISLILNILEEEWIDHLINVDESRWVSSQTSKGLTDSHPDTYTTTVSNTRKSLSVIFEHFEDEIISKIERRVALVAGIDLNYLEKLVMVKYGPGDYFKQHHDGGFRSHTILLYLNDTNGGETVFPRIGISIKPMANSAVFWENLTSDGEMDHRLIHAGTTPKSGTKFVVNCFFNVEPVRLM